MKNKILFGIIGFLLLLYVFSFIKPKDNRKSITSALVNNKNVESIKSFILTEDDQQLIIEKLGDCWFVNQNLACDTIKINRFIDNLVSIRKMYKLSDKKTDYLSYGLSDNDAFSVKYNFGENKQEEILFGKEDFSGTSKYLKTTKSDTVFEIDNSLNVYLSTSASSWYDPLIVSQNILGKIKAESIQRIRIENNGNSQIKDQSWTNWNENVNKLLELRHGGERITQNKSQDLQLILELGNKNQIEIIIYNTDFEGEYNVEVKYYETSGKSYETKQKISLWTYNKIKEIML